MVTGESYGRRHMMMPALMFSLFPVALLRLRLLAGSKKKLKQLLI
jgi:hypothetical protein